MGLKLSGVVGMAGKEELGEGCKVLHSPWREVGGGVPTFLQVVCVKRCVWWCFPMALNGREL